MKYIISVFLVITFFLSANAQKVTPYKGDIIIYPTFENYISNTGIRHEGAYQYKNLTFLLGRTKYIFRDQNKRKLKVNANDIWGFKWGDALYRISGFNQAMYVVYKDKICYYEVSDIHDGRGRLVTPYDDPDDRKVEVTESVISYTLNSTLYAVRYSRKGWGRRPNKEGVIQVLSFVQGERIFDCLMDRDNNFKVLRLCIEELGKTGR